MYTVVIAEKEHVESIDEYALYLEPFLDGDRFSVCRWNTGAAGGLEEIVPDLEKKVDRRRAWRAVILCDERGLGKRNPFDIVEYREPKAEPGESPEEYAARRREAKELTWRTAAREPLVRLVTHLCEDPVACSDGGAGETLRRAEGADTGIGAARAVNSIVDGMGLAPGRTQKSIGGAGAIPGRIEGNADGGVETVRERAENRADGGAEAVREKTERTRTMEIGGQEYLGYADYLAEARLKQEIRGEIRQGAKRRIAEPAEILCIAKRHLEDRSDELANIWQQKDEREYSRFYDRNLYYERMRYLIFDIEDKRKRNYRSDYIRFLNVVCVIAANEEPTGCLRPERVYRLVCDADEGNMACILRRYVAKLNATKEALREKIEDIRQAEAATLKDEEVRNTCCSKVTIPVRMELNLTHDDMKFLKRTGLAADCPVNCEENLWMAFYEKNRRDVKKLMREPPRAIRQSAEQVRMICARHEEVDARLTPDQVGEIEHHISQEELAMTGAEIGNAYDNREIYRQMDLRAHAVRTEMKRRMKSFPLTMFGILPLLVVVLSLVPILLMNRESAGYMALAGSLGVAVLCGMAVSGLIYLIYCWWTLRKKIKEYNVMIEGVMREVDRRADQYSEYLSHACNFMRTTEVLDRYKEHLGADVKRIGRLEKHIQDIDRCRAGVEDIFREFLYHEGKLPETDAIPYDYDFERTADYAYPIPPMPDMRKQIVFMEKGRTVQVPYGTISGLTLRREELYD